MTIGKKILELRTQKKLTQKQLSDICGFSQSALNLWENEKRQPKVEQLYKIAEALEIPIADLLGELYQEKNSDMFDKLFFGNIDPENITSDQLEEFYHTVMKNEVIRESWETEKEKWAIQEITKYLKNLNPSGQDEAVIRVEELTHSPRFKKLFIDEDPPQS